MQLQKTLLLLQPFNQTKMRKIEIELFSFDELSENTQNYVLQKFKAINVKGIVWYDRITNLANSIGVRILGHQVTAGVINIELEQPIAQIALDIELNDYEEPLKLLSGKFVSGESDYAEFTANLSDYLLYLLTEEFTAITQDAHVINAIEANEYEFTKSGHCYNLVDF